MADFDNGVPPSGTNISETSIYSVSQIGAKFDESDTPHIASITQIKDDVAEADTIQISSVGQTKSDFEEVEDWKISFVNYTKEQVPPKILYCSFL